MINKRSDSLVILIATYNRLDLLRKTLEAIERETRIPHETIVTDGGSTDGTIEYLKSQPEIISVFQGKLVGSARAYNQAWREVDSRFSCWLSDDTEIVNGALDTAVRILEEHPEIGMVGLKMKDTAGPRSQESYMGALSTYGILNCNHGVLPTALVRAVGFFNEEYRSYTIDPDLTASVLCAGRSVVMTKNVSVLHHRFWAETGDKEEKIRQDMSGVDNWKIYRKKFAFLESSRTWTARIRSSAGYRIGKLLYRENAPETVHFGINACDWRNLSGGRFIRWTDSKDNARQPFHLVQKIPRKFLVREDNPYRHLVDSKFDA